MTADFIFLCATLCGAFLIGLAMAWMYLSTRNNSLYLELNKSSQALDNSILQLDDVNASMQSLRQQLQEQRTQGVELEGQFIDLERKLILSAPAVFSDNLPNSKFARALGLSIFNEVPPDHKDQLTKVEGISPFLESRLNELGLRTFEQIATLDKDQVRSLNEAIECFPGRIKEEKWVQQCAELSLKKLR